MHFRYRGIETMEPQSQNDFRMSTKFDAVFGSVVNESGRSEREEGKENENKRHQGEDENKRN